MDEKCGYKTPTSADSLEQQIIDPSFPKNEREWWASAETTRLRAEVEALTDALTRNGFRRCDIAACNCGSWHYEGGYRQRFNEFVEALSEAGHPLSNENGNTPLRALGELIAEVEALRADAERFRFVIYETDPSRAVGLFENALEPHEIVAMIDAARAAQGGKT